MQFKHPEIFYALFLLIIPILIHLFQLKRFKTTPFTNLKFLTRINLATRKSKQLKKYLILLCRLLAITSLVFAFSQPYFSEHSNEQQLHTSIYVDNSYSMQGKSTNGELLKNTVQTLIRDLSGSKSTFSLFTNNSQFENIGLEQLKDKLIDLEYTPITKDLNSILLQMQLNMNQTENNRHAIVLISDFQNINLKKRALEVPLNAQVYISNLKPELQNNIYIDSLSVVKQSDLEITLDVSLKSTQSISSHIPVALYSNDELVAKATTIFDASDKSNVQFTLNNTANFSGKFLIYDQALEFDNSFYFSIITPAKINVLSIGNSSAFLPKIYNNGAFEFSSTTLANLNYNQLQEQQVILLNELDNIPDVLKSQLQLFCSNGGTLVIIPGEALNISSFNQWFSTMELGSIQQKVEQERNITSIHYAHPVFKHVFEKEVANFKFPDSKLYYNLQSKNKLPILDFDNKHTFCCSINYGNGSVFWFASPLNEKTASFSRSPLIVPLFYKIGKSGGAAPSPYHFIDQAMKISIPISLPPNNILKIEKEASAFIPLQKQLPSKIELSINNQIAESGIYTITHNANKVFDLAFNYSRKESDLNYLDPNTLSNNKPNIHIDNGLGSVLEKISSDSEINWIFKWFLAFSVLFLLLEMLILKYFKI